MTSPVYWSAAKKQGYLAAEQGKPRNSNPWPGADYPFARQDWFDGWDEAMVPDADEMPGGGPL